MLRFVGCVVDFACGSFALKGFSLCCVLVVWNVSTLWLFRPDPHVFASGHFSVVCLHRTARFVPCKPFICGQQVCLRKMRGFPCAQRLMKRAGPWRIMTQRVNVHAAIGALGSKLGRRRSLQNLVNPHLCANVTGLFSMDNPRTILISCWQKNKSALCLDGHLCV